MTPEQIADRMTGKLEDGKGFLPADTVQNHAAFLARLPDGDLVCAWFGGSLEGKSDIAIHASVLDEATRQWSDPIQLTDLPDRSEQNPVVFPAPDGRVWLFNTAQPHGNQDEATVWMRELVKAGPRLTARDARRTDLPAGTFIRGSVRVRDDGAWVLPLFLCNARKGERWTGAHDVSAIGVSRDSGRHWTVEEVPGSLGCVHMTLVPLGGRAMAAFYRRRQADAVFRSESLDGGRSWSVPEPTDVPNNNASICADRLPDGRIALVCNPVDAAQAGGRRASLYDELAIEDARPDAVGGCTPIWGVERAPLALCLSEDGGRTFPVRHVVEDGPGTCLSNNSLDGRNKELSYPALLPREDGGLDIAFTYHRRAIRHVRHSAETMRRIAG